MADNMRRKQLQGKPKSSAGSSPKANAACATRTKPKRPLSAYNIFFQEQRRKVQEERHAKLKGMLHTNASTDSFMAVEKMGFADLARHIAAKWSVLDDDSKAHYETLANEDFARYQQELGSIELGERKAASQQIESDLNKAKAAEAAVVARDAPQYSNAQCSWHYEPMGNHQSSPTTAGFDSMAPLPETLLPVTFDGRTQFGLNPPQPHHEDDAIRYSNLMPDGTMHRQSANVDTEPNAIPSLLTLLTAKDSPTTLAQASARDSDTTRSFSFILPEPQMLQSRKVGNQSLASRQLEQQQLQHTASSPNLRSLRQLSSVLDEDETQYLISCFPPARRSPENGPR